MVQRPINNSPLFSFDTRTRFKSQFYIGALKKCVKRTLCFIFLNLSKWAVTRKKYIKSTQLTLNNPYLGVWGKARKYRRNYLCKTTLITWCANAYLIKSHGKGGVGYRIPCIISRYNIIECFISLTHWNNVFELTQPLTTGTFFQVKGKPHSPTRHQTRGLICTV